MDQPGDFVTRRVAGRDLVLSRDSTGVMRCFLNACPHRGAKIVREKTGNARSFTCIYHAWQFNNAGKLIGLNGPATYAPDIKADPLHQLPPAPLLDEYSGLVFVHFDAGPPTLRADPAGSPGCPELTMCECTVQRVDRAD